ncbi:MAG: hypothetical protein BIFFINMI_01596 [Phycisphaerae bacterium]|nr:hypothetical protein [Phycisphaerae bacterium]
MAKPVKAIPDGYHTVTPSIVIQDADRDIPFYEKAFGARVKMCMNGPDGKMMHAEMVIGDSHMMLGGESDAMGCKAPATLGARSSALYLYVPDADAAFDRAVKAGAAVVMPVTDMFWGDRCGTVLDPSGHQWSLATHKQDLSEVQIKKAAEEWMAKMSCGE